jgi:hypothetical protein
LALRVNRCKCLFSKYARLRAPVPVRALQRAANLRFSLTALLARNKGESAVADAVNDRIGETVGGAAAVPG